MNLALEILFENKDYLIINKPAGLVVHPDGKTEESTVADWIMEKYPEVAGVGESLVVKSKEGNEITIDRPGIVHRIDRDTSGCLVITKNQESFLYLKGQFQSRFVEKKYIAIVYGNIKNNEGVIDASIGRSKKDFRRWTAQRDARGAMRDAVTEYSVIARFIETGEHYSIVEFRPKTGRTHQIRVHAKYMNHPLVSDELYAGKRGPALGLTRHALHAWTITFIDHSGKEIAALAPFPEDMQKVLEKYTDL